ncbi:MAG TPA: hypothetical protein VF228_09025 [Iamia sp.]
MSDDTGKTHGLIGKVREKVGWLTADREAEAKGKVEQTDDDVSDDQVEQAERDLRQDYEEYDPAVDDAPVAEDVTPADADPRTG